VIEGEIGIGIEVEVEGEIGIGNEIEIDGAD
jgi:hypothetical protein